MHLSSGPIWIEIEPGHCVDLTQVFEFYDRPDDDTLLICLPAPAVGSKSLGVRSGDGPHQLVLSGESRALALCYFQRQIAQSRAAFAAIERAERRELFTNLERTFRRSRVA